ncbi:hypothetical protein AOLI_G00205970 [Acnodon oligacanthus]
MIAASSVNGVVRASHLRPGERLPLLLLKAGNGVQNTAVLRILDLSSFFLHWYQILKYLQSDKEGSKQGVEN